MNNYDIHLPSHLHCVEKARGNLNNYAAQSLSIKAYFTRINWPGNEADSSSHIILQRRMYAPFIMLCLYTGVSLYFVLVYFVR